MWWPSVWSGHCHRSSSWDWPYKASPTVCQRTAGKGDVLSFILMKQQGQTGTFSFVVVFIWNFCHQKNHGGCGGGDRWFRRSLSQPYGTRFGPSSTSWWVLRCRVSELVCSKDSVHVVTGCRHKSCLPFLAAGLSWLKVQCMESSCCGIFCDMTKCCGRGIVGVNLNLSHFSHDVSRSCFKKVCCVHASPGSWISPRPQGCGYWNGPMSQVRGTILRLDRAATLALHFFGLSGIYDVLDADMRLGMQWESLFHDRKCRADFFHFEGCFLDAVHNLYNCHRQLEARRCNMIFMSTAVMSIRSCS